MIHMSFETLGLHAALMAAVNDAGYTQATSVQERAIPAALEGKDLMVSAQTGSGKTACYLLPALHKVLAQREGAASPHGARRARAGVGAHA
jgi:superfamily II DNA/RNA helicase